MAAKRTATSDLNHDNWDREDDVEEAGTFQKASDDVLKRRVIKTARRRNPLGTSDNGEGEEGTTKKTVFGGFTGFSSFAPPNPNSAFSFLANTNTPSITMTNGTEKSFKKATPSTKNNKEETKTKVSEASTSSESNEPDRTEYYAKLKGLNESVLSWIDKHVKENPFINLKPVFSDYDRFLTDLEVKYVKVDDDTQKELTTFSFKTPTSNPPATAAKPPSQPVMSFGSSTSPTFSFGSQSTKDMETSSPTFVFGSTNAAKSAPGTDIPKSSFVWGQKSATTGSGLFSNASASAWPKPQSTSATPPPGTSKDNAETNEDEDEPPKVEFTPVVEDDHIYSIRCKVFVKKDGNFGDRGVGNMYLKRVPDSEKVQLIVRADTNLGNLLCNFILSESVPTQRMGKKDVMLVCIPTPDCKPPPIPILLRVKSPEEADSLLKELEKHKK